MRPLIKVISTMRDLLISFNARSTSQLLVLVAAGTLHIYTTSTSLLPATFSLPRRAHLDISRGANFKSANDEKTNSEDCT